MNYQKEEIESKNIDHLGIIAGIIDEIGIIEKINEIFSVDSREKVNTGEVVKKYGIDTKYSHLDSSSLHLHGKYDNCLNNLEKELGINREHPIMITQGYSRDYRPDLKQCILDLIVSSDGDIPLFFRGASGNESDKAVFAHILVEYSKQIDFESIMVADSALYRESNLKLMSNMKWISRVPLSIKKAKNLVKSFINQEIKNQKIPDFSKKSGI